MVSQVMGVDLSQVAAVGKPGKTGSRMAYLLRVITDAWVEVVGFQSSSELIPLLYNHNKHHRANDSGHGNSTEGLRLSQQPSRSM